MNLKAAQFALCFALLAPGALQAEDAVSEAPSPAPAAAEQSVIAQLEKAQALGSCTITQGTDLNRYALAVGVTQYKKMRHLLSPVRDVERVADALKALGYTTVVCREPTNATFEPMVDAFYAAVPKAADTRTAFYFSGHGGFADGDHRLYGSDSTAKTGLDLDELVAQLSPRPGFHVLLSDACRNRVKDVVVTPVHPEGGVYVGFGAAPGESSLDGDATRLSPFAQGLVEALAANEAATTDVDVLLRRVRGSVMAATQGQQVPWSSHNLVTSVTF